MIEQLTGANPPLDPQLLGGLTRLLRPVPGRVTAVCRLSEAELMVPRTWGEGSGEPRSLARVVIDSAGPDGASPQLPDAPANPYVRVVRDEGGPETAVKSVPMRDASGRVREYCDRWYGLVVAAEAEAPAQPGRLVSFGQGTGVIEVHIAKDAPQ
jgi:hypothetical protein